jgi:hypothetical protein
MGQQSSTLVRTVSLVPGLLFLARMAELEAEIGRGGMLALAPLLGPLEHRAREKFRAGNENPNQWIRGF